MSCCCGTKEKVQKLDCCDFGLIKISILAFALMAAKLWPSLLSLEWYWYAIVLVLVLIKPMVRMYKK